MAYASDNRTATATLGDRFNALIAPVKASIAWRRLYNRTFNELNALSAAELADIGLNRSMIKAVAIEAANKG